MDIVLEDSQPFSVIRDEEFRNFVQILKPSSSIPTRKTVKTMVEARYTKSKEKTLTEIKLASAVSLTADMWTSVNMDADLGVTCLDGQPRTGYCAFRCAVCPVGL